MEKVLSGKDASFTIREKLKIKIEKLKLKLVVIKIGNDKASEIYLNSKRKICKEMSILFEVMSFSDNCNEDDLIKKIEELNSDMSVTGVLLQLPIPKHFNIRKIIDSIDPKKDVDGLTTTNLGNLITGNYSIIPCTVKGILELLAYYNISLYDKDVCIIGRSILVGKPLSVLFTNMNANVSLCHSKTSNLDSYTKKADIIVCSVGKPNFLTGDMINNNSIILDVGINEIDGKLYGDLNVESVKDKNCTITPVPGGIGIMTVTGLLENLYECYKLQNNIN